MCNLREPFCRLFSGSDLWPGVSDPQRFLRIAFENALDLAGKGGKNPGKLHFDAQGIAHDRDFSRHGLAKGHDPQIRRIAVPIDLAISQFVDVIAA